MPVNVEGNTGMQEMGKLRPVLAVNFIIAMQGLYPSRHYRLMLMLLAKY